MYGGVEMEGFKVPPVSEMKWYERCLEQQYKYWTLILCCMFQFQV